MPTRRLSREAAVSDSRAAEQHAQVADAWRHRAAVAASSAQAAVSQAAQLVAEAEAARRQAEQVRGGTWNLAAGGI